MFLPSLRRRAESTTPEQSARMSTSDSSRWTRAAVELCADEELVDDLHEMLGLLLDHVQQPILLAALERVAVGDERARAAVDRRQRCSQLV